MSGTVGPPRPGGPLRASVAAPPTADIAGLVRAAGGLPEQATYTNGVLSVAGISQEALDAALAAGLDPLHAQRAMLKSRAGAEMARRIAAGMRWGERTLQIDEASQGRMTAVSLQAFIGALPGGIDWRMADNSLLHLDAAAVVAMSRAAAGYVAALRARYWHLVDTSRSAADAAALAAVDWEQGWPTPPADEFAPA